jgi:hypothetical protein
MYFMDNNNMIKIFCNLISSVCTKTKFLTEQDIISIPNYTQMANDDMAK